MLYSRTSKISQQDIEKYVIYVYFKLNNLCINKNHHVESVTITAKNLLTNSYVDVTAYHCKTCDKYFINYKMLEFLFNKNIYPTFKYNVVESSWGILKPVSMLRLYGYRVRQNDLSREERQNILRQIIDYKIMRKDEIIKNIQSKIDFNGKKQGNEIARKKWEEDILFVTTYDTESQIRISGTFKRLYQK